MAEMLQEYCDSRGVAVRVDRRGGIIRGVKILGVESRNGRTYLPAALAEAARLYENAKVNVNHPRGNPSSPRDYQDRIGAIRNVVVRSGEGLFADLHFNPKHSLAEQLAWDAEHSPENVGFSHNVEARCARRGDRVMVEAITRVQSVDLVADPATTRGLFESAAERPEDGDDAQAEANAAGPEQDVVDADDGTEQSVENELEQLRGEVESYRAADARRQRRKAAEWLLGECRLAAPELEDLGARGVDNERFIELLLAAPDERMMREMVEERAQFARAMIGVESRPRSRDQHQLYASAPDGAKSFVEAIT